MVRPIPRKSTRSLKRNLQGNKRGEVVPWRLNRLVGEKTGEKTPLLSSLSSEDEPSRDSPPNPPEDSNEEDPSQFPTTPKVENDLLESSRLRD